MGHCQHLLGNHLITSSVGYANPKSDHPTHRTCYFPIFQGPFRWMLREFSWMHIRYPLKLDRNSFTKKFHQPLWIRNLIKIIPVQYWDVILQSRDPLHGHLRVQFLRPRRCGRTWLIQLPPKPRNDHERFSQGFLPNLPNCAYLSGSEIFEKLFRCNSGWTTYKSIWALPKTLRVYAQLSLQNLIEPSPYKHNVQRGQMVSSS